MSDFWQPGDIIVRRESLMGHPWIEFPVTVVHDGPDFLAVFLATDTPMTFPAFPYPDHDHPWGARGVTRWSGHGKLMLQRPNDPYSVDLFWQGPERTFRHWYINLQNPPQRTADGFMTLDHELDFLIAPDGTLDAKDADLFEQRVREGRYDAEQADMIRANAMMIESDLRANGVWCDPAWASWRPEDAGLSPAWVEHNDAQPHRPRG